MDDKALARAFLKVSAARSGEGGGNMQCSIQWWVNFFLKKKGQFNEKKKI